jgi:hypothetical protein
MLEFFVPAHTSTQTYASVQGRAASPPAKPPMNEKHSSLRGNSEQPKVEEPSNMLLLLAPCYNPKQASHDKVSEKDLIDGAKLVTIGKHRLSPGKINLFRSFDNFAHGSAAEFLKDLMTKFD